jgi:hypothetical protein
LNGWDSGTVFTDDLVQHLPFIGQWGAHGPAASSLAGTPACSKVPVIDPADVPTHDISRTGSQPQ